MSAESNTPVLLLVERSELLHNTDHLNPCGSWSYDINTKKLTWSLKTFEILGMDPAKGEPSIEWVLSSIITPKSSTDFLSSFKEKIGNTNHSHSSQIKICKSSGEKTYLNVIFSVKRDEQNVPVQVFGLIEDITSWKITEEALVESEEKYRLLIDTASDVIYTIDSNGVVLTVNPTFERQTGHKASESIGKFFGDFIHPDDLKYALELHYMIQAGVTPPIFDMRFKFADGSYPYVEFSTCPLRKDGKVIGTLGIGRNIQERKNTEKALKESEEKYRILIEQAIDSIFVGDKDGNIIEVNTNGCELSGYSKKELLRMNVQDLFSSEELKRMPFRYDILMKGEPVKCERFLSCKNGSVIPVEMNTKRMSNGMCQVVMQNISERKAAEDFMLKYQEELEKLVKKRTKELVKINTQLKNEITEHQKSEEKIKIQLREKEILIKEIHHRVKNNMQVIISLLNLHANSINEPRIFELYKQSQNRIKSMALIHEQLYQSKDFSRIDFNDYLSSLAAYFSQISRFDKTIIDIIVKAGNLFFEFDTAITLGLILNELLSNSIKYAFKEQAKGEIVIEVKESGKDTIILSVSDNGCGIPQNINYRDTKSLGLQLVCSLAEQIGGTLTLDRSNGTHFKIEFPKKY